MNVMTSLGVAAQAWQQREMPSYRDKVTVWKAKATCHYSCAVRHLHARAQLSPCGWLQYGRGC